MEIKYSYMKTILISKKFPKKVIFAQIRLSLYTVYIKNVHTYLQLHKVKRKKLLNILIVKWYYIFSINKRNELNMCYNNN